MYTYILLYMQESERPSLGNDPKSQSFQDITKLLGAVHELNKTNKVTIQQLLQYDWGKKEVKQVTLAFDRNMRIIVKELPLLPKDQVLPGGSYAPPTPPSQVYNVTPR